MLMLRAKSRLSCAWWLCTPKALFIADNAIYSNYRAAACDVTGVWLPLILMLQSCKIFKVILEAQVTQICSMDILRLTIDFIKMSKVWSFMYGVLWRMARSCHLFAFDPWTSVRTLVVFHANYLSKGWDYVCL